jgi:hypothetical protein
MLICVISDHTITVRGPIAQSGWRVKRGLRAAELRDFLIRGVAGSRMMRPLRIKIVLLSALAFLFAGCFASYWTYSSAGGGTDYAIGEQHDVAYAEQQTFVHVQDVLRGEGILFEVRPDKKIVTNWRDADEGAGVWGSLVGVHPRYRYEIEVVPTGPRQSRIVANLRAEDIPDEDLKSYAPTKRLELFAKVDQLLAAEVSPTGHAPREGGVNFALLPGEDLKALAKRATGNADNWRQIAKDNGLTSPTDLTGVTSVWVSNRLLGEKKGAGN